MKGKWFYSVFAVILLIYFVYLNFFLPVQGQNTVIVRKGELARDVAVKLKEKGIIERPDLFVSLAKLLALGDDLKSGLYSLKKNLPELRLLLYLALQSKGGRLIRVRILEGWELKKIASELSYRLGVDSLRFLRLASDTLFIRELRAQYPEIDSPPSLEGYILPDTYKLPWGVGEERLLRYFVGHTVSVWRREFRRDADSLGMSMKEVLTLASIIEKEAQVEREKPLISAVFHNRLRRGRPLQSCATIEYVLPRRKKVLSFRELKLDSPYNTYLIKGLPPGPIASPSTSSIKAALHPADVDYLYFVSKGDGTHFFSRTLAEHLHYKRIARQLWRKKEEEAQKAAVDSTKNGEFIRDNPLTD